MSFTKASLADYRATHFSWRLESGIAYVELNTPQRKNPLTFESYAELRDLFRALCYDREIRVVIISGAGNNFCSGGDVHDIIGPLTKMSMPDLLDFTRMTGDLVRAIRACPQLVIAAVDGICAGAGAILAMVSDLRLGTPAARTAFLFARVGLAGCDMGACSILPRLIGQGRAAELMYTGRVMTAEEGERWGFFNQVVKQEDLLPEATALAQRLSAGPSFAHAMTKNMLNQEWSMSVDQALEAEAQAQAICMRTEDFERAYRAFAERGTPQFVGR